MSHRKGLPKPSATERTRYRYRVRHDVETVQDKKRLGIADYIKDTLYKMRHPEEEESQ